MGTRVTVYSYLLLFFLFYHLTIIKTKNTIALTRLFLTFSTPRRLIFLFQSHSHHSGCLSQCFALDGRQRETLRRPMTSQALDVRVLPSYSTKLDAHSTKHMLIDTCRGVLIARVPAFPLLL